MTPGDVLPNGATVIAVQQRPAGGDILLCLTSAREYATWYAPRGTVATHWGEYFGKDFHGAVQNWNSRAGGGA